MLIKRVIPCLDVHDGKVTRGVQFGRAEAGELRNVGDPVELALRYDRQGADDPASNLGACANGLWRASARSCSSLRVWEQRGRRPVSDLAVPWLSKLKLRALGDRDQSSGQS